MPLNRQSTQGLLDSLQKVSLAITAVSVALWSNVLLPRHNIDVDAKHQLDILIHIQDELDTKTVRAKLEDNEKEAGLSIVSDNEQDLGRLRPSDAAVRPISDPKLTSERIIVHFPHRLAIHRSQGPPKILDIGFGDIKDLNTMIGVWNEVCEVTYWNLRVVATASLRPRNPKLPSLDLKVSSVTENQGSELANKTIDLDKGIQEFDLYPESLQGRFNKDNQTISFDYQLRPKFDKLVIDDEWKAIVPSNYSGETIDLTVDVKVDPIPIFLGKNQFEKKLDTFDKVFPDLEKLSKEEKQEDLKSLEGKLEERIMSQHGKETVEFLGAKFTTDLIAIVGMPILAALLFQFAAIGSYIVSNVEELDEEIAAAWSFLLRGGTFLVINIGVILFLPVVASIWTASIFIADNLWIDAVYLSGMVAVILCSCWAFFAMLRLRVMVGDTMQAAKEIDHSLS